MFRNSGTPPPAPLLRPGRTTNYYNLNLYRGERGEGQLGAWLGV